MLVLRRVVLTLLFTGGLIEAYVPGVGSLVPTRLSVTPFCNIEHGYYHHVTVGASKAVKMQVGDGLTHEPQSRGVSTRRDFLKASSFAIFSICTATSAGKATATVGTRSFSDEGELILSRQSRFRSHRVINQDSQIMAVEIYRRTS